MQRHCRRPEGVPTLPPMPRSPFHAPNFYAGVPLDRADRLRGDAERLAALLHDPQCRVVPLWRNQHLIAAEAEVPRARADRLRGCAGRLAAVGHDPQCRGVPLWRNQHLSGAGAEAVVRRLADLEGLLESPPPEWGEAIFLGLREEVAYVAIDFSRLEEPQIGPLTAGRGSFQDLRAVGPIIRREEGALLAYARGPPHWHSPHGFCRR